MHFATFYHRAVYPAGTDKLTEACGDRAVIILDGRSTHATRTAIAREECAKRGYLAFQLHIGATFARVQWSGPVVKLSDER